jgi:hypothetical protein
MTLSMILTHDEHVMPPIDSSAVEVVEAMAPENKDTPQHDAEEQKERSAWQQVRNKVQHATRSSSPINYDSRMLCNGALVDALI